MRKILTIVSLLSLITFNANALDRSSFSATVGIAQNNAVYGATAKETNRAEDNTVKHIKNESGVFTEGHSSGFLELNIGDFVSFGVEHTPDAISTPQKTTRDGTANEANVSVDFNDLNIAYLKLNIPGGAYLKAGIVDATLDVKETMGSGSTYSNASTEGTVMALGYAHAIGDTPFSIRVEGSYMSLDDVTSSNGVSITGGSVANGGRNQIDVRNLEGLTGKLALTFTLGK